MANEAQKILDSLLGRVQQNARIRNAVGIALVLALLGVGLSFLYELLPRQYALSMSGGEILSNRHYLARLLQKEAAQHGIAMTLDPMSGSREALTAVDEGRLDMAVIQDGLDNKYPNVRHVAYIGPEPLHLLVHPDIKEISDLVGKRVNLGALQGGTRIVAKQVFEFSALEAGVQYVETNFSPEELLQMRPDKLPDAVVIAALAPSDAVEFLIKERGFVLLEIPFPASLALRLGWVADSKILAYTYNVKPAVPARDIKTIGVNIHLVANKDVEPRAVFQVLESLYAADLESKLKLKVSEDKLTTSSGYPLSEGSKLFMARKNPLLSAATLDKLKGLFGLVLSTLSTVLVVLRWFKGAEPPAPEPQWDDAVFVEWLTQVGQIEQDFDQGTDTGSAQERAGRLHAQLAGIKAAALERAGTAKLQNPQLPHLLLLAISDARARCMQLLSIQGDSP
ncbi:MAG: hypothetical protein HXX19_08065 [Rhodoferax sp.]|nr:hypothetical protein [Rhodoferax sp.]